MGFFDVLVHPREVLEKEIPNTNLNAALKTYAIYGAITGLLLGIFFALLFGFLGAILGAATSEIPIVGVLAGLGLASIVVMPILMVILILVSTVIVWGIYWIIAKVLGGTGTFTQNYFLSSKLVWPVLVAGLIVGILSLIPLLGFLIMLAWTLYSIYIHAVAISVANKISVLKAVIVYLIPVVIIIVLVILLLGAILATLPLMAYQ